MFRPICSTIVTPRKSTLIRSVVRRSGRALTEIVMIVVIPCLCLGIWGLLDSELKRSLMAGPQKDGLLVVNPVYDAVMVGDDEVLTVQGLGQLRLWKLSQSAQIGEMQSHMNEVRSVAYSPLERLLAVGSAMGKFEVWDLNHPEAPQVSNDPSLHEISDCLFSPDGQQLLTTGEDGKVIVWNPRTLERLVTLESPEPVEAIRSLALSRDGKILLAGTHSGRVRVWDMEKREHLHSHMISLHHKRPEAAIEAVAFINGDHEYIVGSRNEGVSIRNVATGECVRKLEGAVAGMRSGTLSADGNYFMAGTEDGEVIRWDTASGQRIANSSRYPSIIRCLLTDDSGQAVLVGDWHGRVRFEHN